MGLLLGLDVGTTAVKAGLFDPSGRMVASAGEEYRLDTPAADRAELDPEVYWTAAMASLHQVLATEGVDRSAIEAIAVSSQGETVVPLGSDDRPLGPALVWLDNRATAEAHELEERFGTPRIYDVTGVPSVFPTWTACKLLWWKRNDPAVYAAAHFLLVEEFILHRLTGRHVADAGVQCTSLLYDIVDRRWWREMLDALELEPSRFGEPVEPGDIVGTLTTAAAGTLGLPAGVLVIAGGMDQGAGAVGVGNTGPGVISESTGGALTLQATVTRHGGDPSRQTPVYVHSAPGTYLYCPVCPTGGLALTWFRDQFGAAEIERAGREGRSAYELLTELATEIPPGAEGLTMLPHLMGAFSPEYDPDARGVFFGFTLRHERGHFVRAILEAVAFMLRRNLELLGTAGATATEVHSHGGGARSRLWNQIKADVCDLPVVTMEGEDAAIRGDAMLAGVACGAYADLDEARQAMIAVRDRYLPDPATRNAYDGAYRRYGELFDALRPVFGAAARATADAGGR